MQVRLAKENERAVAVDLLVRRWGDPVVVRSRFYPIDACDIFIAGNLEGIAAVSGQTGQLPNWLRSMPLFAIKELDQHFFGRL